MFRFWDCATHGCPNAAAVDVGACESCESLYCAAHLRSAKHTCDPAPLDDEAWLAAQTRELTALWNKTNHEALLRRATELSGGKPCRLDNEDPLGRSLMGGMHVHLQILFDDGSIWLARILRENYTSFDDELSNEILLSECATLKWLDCVDAPTPKLHGYGLRGDHGNDVGVAYMLIEKLPGKPFDAYTASQEQKDKVLGQWAKVLATLMGHPFETLGSLKFEPDGTLVVGPVASDRTGTLPPIGPFNRARDLYSAWATAYLDLVAEKQLFSDSSTDTYLIFSHLLKQIREGPWLDQWNHLDSGPFFLKHMDDKGDHVLVDDDYNITGIIDWTFARLAPAYEAFGPSLMTADTSLLFDGQVGLSREDDVLRRHLEAMNSPYNFFQSDKIRRLILGPGMGLGPSQDESIALFKAIVSTFEQDKTFDWAVWREMAVKSLADDAQLKKFLSSQPEQFVSRFATCSTPNCERPSLRGRSCQSCQRHLCAIHALAQFHHCSSAGDLDDAAWEAGITSEIEALLALINVPKLIELASSLRGHVSCNFVPGKFLGSGAIMGCANYHVELKFDDGACWLVRIPRTTTFSDVPPTLVEYLVESEYATLKWLQGLDIPTPKVHAYGLASDPGNAVGVSYILEDALPGQPFYAHEATQTQKTRVYEQYARYLLEIKRHPRTQACSLLPRSGQLVDGPIASNRFLTLATYGPFKTSAEYFSAVAEEHVKIIADGQIYPKFPKEAFIFYSLLRDRAAPILARQPGDATTATATKGEERFFLKHVDDKGDHILVDKDYNITGIIDWQFARFVPYCEAFGPSLFTADLSSLYGGDTGLGADDRLLAEFLAAHGVLKKEKEGDGIVVSEGIGELARRFNLGLASGLAQGDVLCLLQAVVNLLNDHESGIAGRTKVDEAWVEKQWSGLADRPWYRKTASLIADIERAREG